MPLSSLFKDGIINGFYYSQTVLSVRALTPVIGTRSVRPYDDTEGEEYDDITEIYVGNDNTYQGNILPPSESEHVNTIHGINDRFSVQYDFTNKPNIVVPVIPLYAEMSLVSLHGQPGYPDEEKRYGSVASVINFNQPLLTVSGGAEPDLSSDAAFYHSLCALKNVRSKQSTSAVVVPWVCMNDQNEKVIDYLSYISSASPGHIFVGNSVLDRADNSLELSGEAIIYDSIDMFSFTGKDENSHLISLIVEYMAIPITPYTCTNQSGLASDDFSLKVAGHQSIALIPVAVSGIFDIPPGQQTRNAVVYTRSMAIRYKPKALTGYLSQDNHIEIDVLKAVTIYSDDECSVVNLIVKEKDFNLNAITYSALFGVSCFGGELSFPLNASPFVRFDGVTKEVLESLSILSIEKLESSNNRLSINMKISLSGLPSKAINILKYSNASDCEFAIVNIYSDLASNVSQPYAMSGSIGNHRLTSVTLLKETGAVRLESLNSLETQNDTNILTPINLASFGWDIKDESSSSWLRAENSMSCRSKMMSGNKFSMSVVLDSYSDMWYGKHKAVISPTTSFDGHGEASVYGASHLMNLTIFPLVYPLPVLVSTGVDSFGLDVKRDVAIPIHAGTGEGGGVGGMFDVALTSKALFDDDVYKCRGFGWFVNLYQYATLSLDVLSGIPRNSFVGTDDSYHKISCSNSYCRYNDQVDNDYRMTYAGEILLYSTPVIGEGNVPTSASFSAVEVGVDHTNNGIICGTKELEFANKKLIYAGYKVYENNSVYNTVCDASSEYKLTSSGGKIYDIYAIGSSLVVGYSGTTVVFVFFNNAISILGTITGSLCTSPIQVGINTYVLTTLNGIATLHKISQGAVLPVFETEADSAMMSYSRSLPPLLYVASKSVLSVYDLSYEGVVLVYTEELEDPYPVLLQTIEDSVSSVVVMTDYDTYEQIELGEDEEAFDIESSEFNFPYIEGTRVLLFGLKLLFANPINSGDSIGLSVYCNGDSAYSNDELDVNTEVVVRFPSVAVGSASYSISGCSAKLRGIKWLAYRLPLINETIV